MLNAQEQGQSLAAFHDDAPNLLQQIKGTHQPITLAVDGRAEAVVLDIDEYQRLLNLAARADEAEGIRQGEEDIRMGRTQPLREAFEEIRRTLGIPR